MTNPTTLQVYVKGTPRPQPRPRFVDGKAISTTSKPAKAYRAVVLAACKSVYAQCGQIKKGPVSITLDLWFFSAKRAKEFGQPHTPRPDGDNVLKLWQDCAQKAGLIAEDSHVYAAFARKRWAATAGALMTVEAYNELDLDLNEDDDLGVCEGDYQKDWMGWN